MLKAEPEPQVEIGIKHFRCRKLAMKFAGAGMFEDSSRRPRIRLSPAYKEPQNLGRGIKALLPGSSIPIIETA